MYNPIGPECPINRLYVERTRQLFKKGQGPPDFTGKPDNELHYNGRATWEDITEEGKIMLGSEEF